MRRLTRLSMIVLLVLGALLTQVSAAAAGSVNVRDDAGALTAADQQTIRDSAARAPFSVYVWTAKGGYSANKAGFVSAADALVTNNDTVVVAVDTVDKFSHVAARNARLTSAATAAAKTTADSSFGQGQWAAGITAALTSLTNAAGASSRAKGAPNQGGNGAPVGSETSFPWAGLLVLLVVVGAITAGVMMLLRSRRRRAMVGPQDAPTTYLVGRATAVGRATDPLGRVTAVGRGTAVVAPVWAGCLLVVPSAASVADCSVTSWAKSLQNTKAVARTATTPAKIRGKGRAASPSPTKVRAAPTGKTAAVARTFLAAISAAEAAPTSKPTRREVGSLEGHADDEREVGEVDVGRRDVSLRWICLATVARKTMASVAL